MPILEEEPMCFPDHLFNEEEMPAKRSEKLFVLHTKPNQEKALVRDLTVRRIPHFLPLKTKRNRSRGRILKSYLPIFSSYVFLLADPEQRIEALATKRVVRTLPVGDPTRLWTDLHRLKQLISGRKPIRTEDNVQPGTIVEICSGPMTGLKGKLVGTDEGRRFVVEIDFIQQGGSVALDKETEVCISDWNF